MLKNTPRRMSARVIGGPGYTKRKQQKRDKVKERKKQERKSKSVY
jgi:hypothetical protein